MLGVLCLACYFRVCTSQMFRACITRPPLPSRRVVSRYYIVRPNFRKAPRGVRLRRLVLSPNVCTPQNALGCDTDSRNVVYDFYHDHAILGPFNASRYGSGGLK